MFTRKITLPAILAILAFSFCTTEILADDNKDEKSKKTEKKEKKETTTEPTSPPKPTYVEDIDLLSDRDVGYGAETSFLTWHGYINFEFDKKQGTHSNFDNHEFYLSTQAHVSRRVSLTAEFEFEHTPEKLILPIQAYADLKIAKSFIFRFGQFYTPMGISRSYNLRGNRNRMIRQVALTHDIMFENWSEIGINIFGQFESGVFYDIAVGNGAPGTLKTGDSFFDSTGDLQSHSEDNNGNKAIHSRFGYHTKRFLNGEVNFGISLGTQKYDPDNTLRMTHTGFDVRFLHNSGVRLQAEYMKRSGDDNAEDLARGISADALGWYVQLSKRFVSKGKKWLYYLEPVVQVDFIDLNTATETNGDKVTTALGFIYSPEPFYLVKFEYDVVKELHGSKVSNNVFWGSIVVEF